MHSICCAGELSIQRLYESSNTGFLGGSLVKGLDALSPKAPITLFIANYHCQKARCGSGTASGSVTFRDKSTVLQTVTLDANGHAAFTTPSLSQGAHQITAAYSGAASYAASTSSTLVENISKK